MVTQNPFVIPATVLEKFRSRWFPKDVTLTADHCNNCRIDLISDKTLLTSGLHFINIMYDLAWHTSLPEWTTKPWKPYSQSIPVVEGRMRGGRSWWVKLLFNSHSACDSSTRYPSEIGPFLRLPAASILPSPPECPGIIPLPWLIRLVVADL